MTSIPLWQGTLQTSQISHKGLLLHTPLESQGVDESEDWLPWKEARQRAIKKNQPGNKMPTSSTKFPLPWWVGKWKGTLALKCMAQCQKGRREYVEWCWRGEGEMSQRISYRTEKFGFRVKKLAEGYASSVVVPSTTFLPALLPVSKTTFPCYTDLLGR